MTFEDLFSTDLNFRIAVYSRNNGTIIFSGYYPDMPDKTYNEIKHCKVTDLYESDDVQVVRISEPLGTFEELLDKHPELFDFDVQIYLGDVLTFSGITSKMPLELMLNLKPRHIWTWEITEDLKTTIIVLDDYSDCSRHDYPLLKDDLLKLRKHHLGWTVIITTQDDDEYDRFILTEELTLYETDPRFQDVLSEQIDTEDNWDDVAEIYIATNICAPFEE